MSYPTHIWYVIRIACVCEVIKGVNIMTPWWKRSASLSSWPAHGPKLVVLTWTRSSAPIVHRALANWSPDLPLQLGSAIFRMYRIHFESVTRWMVWPARQLNVTKREKRSIGFLLPVSRIWSRKLSFQLFSFILLIYTSVNIPSDYRAGRIRHGGLMPASALRMPANIRKIERDDNRKDQDDT